MNTKVKTSCMEVDYVALKVRLDAIVLLLAMEKCGDETGRIKVTDVAPILHKAGYTPTEIAKLLGKKHATDISKYLYKKK